MYKLVPEHINEVLFFKRDQENPLVNLGVGKVNLIKKWLDEMGVTNYIINNDLTINVNNDVNLRQKNLDKFPDYIKFNNVDGWFSCAFNKLTNLEGCPNYVDNEFTCYYNNLISLKGCPTYVGGNFYCYCNEIKFTKDEVKKLCNVKGEIYI